MRTVSGALAVATDEATPARAEGSSPGLDWEAFDHAVTLPSGRPAPAALAPADTVAVDRRACADVLAIHERRRRLTHLLHIKTAPGARGLEHQVERLREQAAAYRTQAIAVNARLAMLESEHEELRGMRERLAETSARLDSAVAEIDAVATVERELARDAS